MTTKNPKKLLAVYKTSAEDEEYCRLARDHERLTKRYLEILPTLTEEQQTALGEYWAVVHAMHHRLLELACAQKRRFFFRRTVHAFPRGEGAPKGRMRNAGDNRT